MLIHFSKQPINSNIELIAELSAEPTDTIVKAINDRTTYANDVLAADKEIARLNNLEAYITECRRMYGNEYRKQDYTQVFPEFARIIGLTND